MELGGLRFELLKLLFLMIMLLGFIMLIQVWSPQLNNLLEKIVPEGRAREIKLNLRTGILEGAELIKESMSKLCLLAVANKLGTNA